MQRALLVLTLPAACLLAPLVHAQAAGEPPLLLRSTPLLHEIVPDGPRPGFLTGGEISGQTNREMRIEGGAELRQPGRVMRADEIHYDQISDVVSARGGLLLNDMGNRYQAESGQLQLDAFEGFLLQPSYELLASGAYGEAERIDFVDPEHLSITAGTYTTCERPGPDWVPDWVLRAATLDIDRDEDEGRAEGAALAFKGVPILAVPRLSFPLSERRKTGLLPPTIGLDSKSGLQLSVPYYWNIAPNRDATFTPELMLRRGINVASEFRYLEDNYEGSVGVDLMPHDRLRGKDRWGVFTRHQGTYGSPLGPLGLALNINRVSDNDYWRDFNGHGQTFTTRLLDSNVGLNWSRGKFSTSLRAQKWQTLQDPLAPIIPPYDRLPQWRARYADLNARGFDYSIEGEVTRFRGARSWTLQPNATRSHLSAEAQRPFVRSWGFLTPRARLQASDYQFDRSVAGAGRSASRVLPTFSLDSGLIFERQARLLGRSLTQTLEPRLKYVYTPHRRQNHLPNYDSAEYDFNFATIWSDDAYAGHDRVADNNLLTAGLTTRFLDPVTGAESLRFAVAQRYRFSPQEVTLPGLQPEGQGWSDLMLGAGVHWASSWWAEAIVQYNADTKRSTRSTLNLRYQPGAYRTLSMAYRDQNDRRSQMLDLGWQWPLSDVFSRRAELGHARSGGGSCSGRWYSVGRLNYSLRDDELVDAIAGLEYDAGCWVGRVVFEKIGTGVSSSTKRVMFQLEFVGLSRLGSSPLRTLRDHIPGYRTLHDRGDPPPSRFGNYD